MSAVAALVVWCVFVFVVVLCGSMYLLDREGWNRTLRRASGILRASVESRKGRGVSGSVEGRKSVQKALSASWDMEFEGRPGSVVGGAEDTHVIVCHDFYRPMGGGDSWPRWTCKCGVSAMVPAGVYGVEESQRRAAQGGSEHVRVFMENEKRMGKGGDFAF